MYRDAPRAARNYVEADRSRADDYYLAEGTGIAQRLLVDGEGRVVAAGGLDGDGYEAWVAGLDPTTGEPRGRLRTDSKAVRFVEVIVNGPKSWSLAAELHPDIAQAYEAAQDSAVRQISGWLGQHATTRVGPRGAQVAVPVQRLEVAVIRHYTSRAGIRTGICICRSTRGCSRPGNGAAWTPWRSGIQSRPSTVSGTPR